MTMGEKLQRLRRARGLSQEELAGALGVSRQAVSKWETSASLPDTEKLLAISDFFGVTADYLLREESLPEETRQPETVSVQGYAPPRKRHRGLAISGWLCTGLGSAGVITLWVLSTMIESWVPTQSTDSMGVTWYSSGPGYAFWPFIEMYRLQALFFLFLLSIFC